MNVNYFRRRRPGPEAAIEDALATYIPQLVPATGYPLWAAGSVPIGAGLPDLVIVSYLPHVMALAHGDTSDSQILAYLRAVGRARIETIVQRTRTSRREVTKTLYSLVGAQAVDVSNDTFSLSPEWRDILPEIVTIEAKVANWHRAVEQAARNRIFAHRSFIALPAEVADRVKSEPVFTTLGIGILSVKEDSVVAVARRARRRQPSVWTYYYELASLVARASTN